ncbi:LacI family DNA-binding transcriptional regulator [Metabacillus sp. GX 13764]|uniref:LacI family DNA-binding transcriptional regulator n=1 Tax=Metabacillus kandeliae TaxID=2900151 RepID=UPI001E2A3CF4|nr:LacI family DNA-binding transcriptional regulator [Metabacillus kandeliae]MCD7036110.1 LacI family DNA-binding transcriptional regulator [Metabacillus kandeliae]
MANIREIAKASGVSQATVSRVLNGYQYVRAEKRESVLKAMETLGYSRNLNAVNLSQGKTDMVGVVLPAINHPYFGAMVEGIAEEAIKKQVQLVLFQSSYEEKKELEALSLLQGRKLDGIIFCSRAAGDQALIKHKSSGPIVLGEDSDLEFFSSVSISHEAAFQSGLQYLMANGHTDIAVCLSRKEGINSLKRIKAYKEQLGNRARQEWIFEGCLKLEDGMKVIGQYRNLKKKPSAFLVTNDQAAAGIMLAAKKENIRIPEDLSLLSFDNQPISGIFGLSTIDIPVKEMGRQLLAALLAKREVPGSSERKLVLPHSIVERKTVKKIT